MDTYLLVNVIYPYLNDIYKAFCKFWFNILTNALISFWGVFFSHTFINDPKKKRFHDGTEKSFFIDNTKGFKINFHITSLLSIKIEYMKHFIYRIDSRFIHLNTSFLPCTCRSRSVWCDPRGPEGHCPVSDLCTLCLWT